MNAINTLEPQEVRRGWNYNKWHIDAKDEVDEAIEKLNDAEVRQIE